MANRKQLYVNTTTDNLDAAMDADDFHALGFPYCLSTNYADGTGTAGADGTAQDVKTIVVPANTLQTVGDRIRIRCHFRGDTGTAITATVKLNGVTIAAATDAGAASYFVTETYLHYIDATHANILETGAYPATGANTAPNVAGFDWTAAQNLVVSQNNIANNHIVVIFLAGDVFPKGVA